MYDPKQISTIELFNYIVKANQKIIKNYCCNFSGYHRDLHDIVLTYSYFFTKLFSEPNELVKVWNFLLEFSQEQQALYKTIFINECHEDNAPEADKTVIIKKKDKRFTAPQWDKYPYFSFIKQNYWLTEQLSVQIIDEVEMGEPIKKKLHFYTQQYTDMFSPSNFLLTNPEIQELTIEKKGENLLYGLINLVHDIKQGRISQVDEFAFEIGKNIAVTPGVVIYENELIQLIQYSPNTTNVYQIPILIIPPWINKYYILDLQQENSFVKFLVDSGFTVCIISWKNPVPGTDNFIFEDYVSKGALKAIEITKDISGAEKINVLGYCLGGTLLSVTCSILAAQKKEIINSITFLASMVDFSDIGPMGDVINEALVSKLERGELLKNGVMHGHDMERAFNLIRAKDMIWKYTINNYLKGNTPPPVDVIYWTNDNTNLPAEMYIYYMRQMILENKLSRKNALRICDTPIDIGKIKAPVFVVGMKEDYISPPATAFATTELVSGPVEFILGGSGHVMGVANPPSQNKYGYYLNGRLNYGYDEWKKTAHFFEGSWWTAWSERLEKNSGNKIPAPKRPGNEKYKTIERAPGKYVKEKC
ncbi:MAG TPA: class I poly(R)-hydroxyalkanoic acid synthase [Bacteroidia bacterium]|jgi:polyhydroxyalkanoate synthase|nr:class I poly(R)-hydroxyalkanoic acid synthase [Bacteroidia bacterium]